MTHDLLIMFVTQMLKVCKNNITFQRSISICQLTTFVTIRHTLMQTMHFLVTLSWLCMLSNTTCYLFSIIPHSQKEYWVFACFADILRLITQLTYTIHNESLSCSHDSFFKYKNFPCTGKEAIISIIFFA